MLEKILLRTLGALDCATVEGWKDIICERDDFAVFNGFKADCCNLCWESSLDVNNLQMAISGFSTCTFNWIPIKDL